MNRPSMLEKIVSGGQTGADRAALDWAINHAYLHGGWCPAGRRAEDGPIAPCYRLEETPTEAYHVRTKWNVRDSDATVIISLNPTLSGGSKLTAKFARKLGKPWMHLSPASSTTPAADLRNWVEEHFVTTLNVAGPRSSTERNVGAYVYQLLDEAFGITSG